MKLFQVVYLSAVCLLISEGADLRIINGNETKAHSRPYMAYIQINDNMICGGILIAADWVLTAAHCNIHGQTKVFLGINSSNFNAVERGRVPYFAKTHVIPKSYNQTTYNNDIQLIKLSRPAKLSESVQPFPLPNKFEDVKAGTTCQTAGWGKTKDNIIAKHLMEVNVLTISRDECRKRLTGQMEITENHICTSVGPEGQDTCQGDSGGPLICDGDLRGVISFRDYPCGETNGAAVYTRLTKEYVDWIKDITAK